MNPKYIDIHSHVNFKAFKEDGEAVIRRALLNDTWLINVGSQYSTSKRAVEIANKYKEGVYAIIGLHPVHTEESYHDEEETSGEGFTSRAEEFDKEKYLGLAKDPKVVAIGECGLDYYHFNPENVEKQKEAFIEQIEFANEVGKPLMLHLRNNYENLDYNAYNDALEIIRKYAKVKGDVHSFEGTLEDAKNFIDFGFTVSFTGAITYPPRKKGWTCNYEEIIKNIPLDMIMTDTDCPYLTPVPHRGERNEPLYVSLVAKRIAEIKGLPLEEVAKTIVSNSKRVFDI